MEKMGDKEAALSIKQNLIKLYSNNYKCGFFKTSIVSKVAGVPFL